MFPTNNPYSESQFRTMKYRPEFPDRFGCIQDSRAFCQQFFQWYNEEHRHSGIALLTPAVVHFGETQTVLAQRQVVLDAAYRAHPTASLGNHQDRYRCPRRSGSTSRSQSAKTRRK